VLQLQTHHQNQAALQLQTQHQHLQFLQKHQQPIKALTLITSCVGGRGSVGLKILKRPRQTFILILLHPIIQRPTQKGILILFQLIIQIYTKYDVVPMCSFLDGPKNFGATCTQNPFLAENVSTKKILLLRRLFVLITMEGSARKKNSNKTVLLDRDAATTLTLSGRLHLAIRRRCQPPHHRPCRRFLPRPFRQHPLLLPVRALHRTRPLCRNLRVWHRCRKITTFWAYVALERDAGSRKNAHTRRMPSTRCDAVPTRN